MNRNTVRIGTLALMLITGGKLLADPLMTSLQLGTQSPDPINSGGTATYNITITKTNSGGMDLYLSTLNLPAGATASFTPNPIAISKSATSGTGTLIISTTNTLAQGRYSFQVVANDGSSHNSMTNTAILDVGSPLGSPVATVTLAQTPSGWRFSFPTQPGHSYQVQATSDLSAPAWTTLCTTNCGTNYLLVFMDTDKTFYSCRFYRAVGQ
jgi:hypothetical protein